jgi:hypothetical protein
MNIHAAQADGIRVISGGAARGFVGGELPRELQKYTVYAAAPTPGTRKNAPVPQLIEHFTSTSARERLAQAGYTPPE